MGTKIVQQGLGPMQGRLPVGNQIGYTGGWGGGKDLNK